jgi:acyl-homoserine-lactone acylase
MQFVTWDDAGPIAEGMLTYSQSSQPSNEHFSDLTKVYAAGKWVKLAYTQAQIAADLKGNPIDLSE